FCSIPSSTPASSSTPWRARYTPLSTQPPQRSACFPPFPSKSAPIITVSSVLLRL
ncbi:hypothetical protein CCMA1212_004542, partial [Trichoderma ghanense]